MSTTTALATFERKIHPSMSVGVAKAYAGVNVMKGDAIVFNDELEFVKELASVFINCHLARCRAIFNLEEHAVVAARFSDGIPNRDEGGDNSKEVHKDLHFSLRTLD